MYIMYVDESGDSGLSVRSPTTHFALSGIVVHERDWRTFVDRLVQFRKTLRAAYGLRVRAEIHASHYINHQTHNLKRYVRLAILRNFIDELATMPYLSVTDIIVDKVGKNPRKYDVFDRAWQTLFQRFENTLKYGNFPGGHKSDYGIVITDATNGRKLMRLVRRMSVINYIPNDQRYGGGSRNEPVIRIVEDPHGKNSADTLPLQACDVCAYFLMQKFRPNSYIKRQHAQHYINRLHPVLNTRASRTDELGIVIL